MSKNANNKQCQVPKGKVVFFATGNINKFNEARSILSQHGIAVGMLRLKGDEIQSDSLKDIAEKSVINAYTSGAICPFLWKTQACLSMLMSGFPGPYAAYVYKTIHNSGILKLLENQKDRQAKFQSVHRLL